MGLISSLKEGVSAISSLFENIGAYCVDVLNAGLSGFAKFIYHATGILTSDISGSEFADFWTVVNNIARVMGIISSTLMVLLFLVNLCTDSWDSRHDIEIYDFMKKCAKMIVAIVLVNNAVPIVTGILKLGALVAGIVTFGDKIDSAGDLANSIGLSRSQETYIEYGCRGFGGFLMWIAFFICAIVVVVCGIKIVMQIYTRIFKIFVLIPFSTLSFTTFVMGDGNRGNEVFHGYLKSIISTSIEAVLIMVSIAFTFALVGGDTMEALFPAMEVEATEAMDMNVYEIAFVSTKMDGDESSAAVILEDYKDKISDKVQELCKGKGRDKTITKYGCMVFSSGEVVESSANMLGLLTMFGDAFSDETHHVQLYPSFTWGGVIMIIIQILFPICICTGAVANSEKYSSMILGH